MILESSNLTHNQAQIITHLLKDMSLVTEGIYSMEGDGQTKHGNIIFFLTSQWQQFQSLTMLVEQLLKYNGENTRTATQKQKDHMTH